MNKKIDLHKSVFEICTQYPEVIDILYQLGFTEITKQTAMQTAGRVMTLANGAKIKGIDLNLIVETLQEAGFEVEGYVDRQALLKSYIQRLNEGEDLENVRADFVQNFKEVDASEIMQAEQDMILSGVPFWEVQQLCDVHSALFHGATRQEKIEQAEKAVEDSLQQKKADALIAMAGHPLSTFALENVYLDKLLEKAQEHIEDTELTLDILNQLRDISIHYAKKGDLLYPLLKVRYDISGPSDVMWGVDDEIRDQLRRLAKNPVMDTDWKEAYLNTIQRAQEMIYKENNILFPLCAQHFTKEEWEQIYKDSFGYEPCLMDSVPVWEEVSLNQAEMKVQDQEVVFPSGHMNPKQLRALLNTIPMEISFVDEQNINRYFNEGYKLFKRPNMAIDREVFSCHPPKIEPMVRKIIDDFRNGRKDSVDVWMEKMGKTVLVRYMAIRDENGEYVGTGEFVQEMDFAKEHFLKQRK